MDYYGSQGLISGFNQGIQIGNLLDERKKREELFSSQKSLAETQSKEATLKLQALEKQNEALAKEANLSKAWNSLKTGDPKDWEQGYKTAGFKDTTGFDYIGEVSANDYGELFQEDIIPQSLAGMDLSGLDSGELAKLIQSTGIRKYRDQSGGTKYLSDASILAQSGFSKFMNSQDIKNNADKTAKAQSEFQTKLAETQNKLMDDPAVAQGVAKDAIDTESSKGITARAAADKPKNEKEKLEAANKFSDSIYTLMKVDENGNNEIGKMYKENPQALARLIEMGKTAYHDKYGKTYKMDEQMQEAIKGVSIYAEMPKLIEKLNTIENPKTYNALAVEFNRYAGDLDETFGKIGDDILSKLNIGDSPEEATSARNEVASLANKRANELNKLKNDENLSDEMKTYIDVQVSLALSTAKFVKMMSGAAVTNEERDFYNKLFMGGSTFASKESAVAAMESGFNALQEGVQNEINRVMLDEPLSALMAQAQVSNILGGNKLDLTGDTKTATKGRRENVKDLPKGYEEATKPLDSNVTGGFENLRSTMLEWKKQNPGGTFEEWTAYKNETFGANK